MEERKIVWVKKEEFAIKEYVKNELGKGKVSKVKIEYTPIGEKIVVSTNKPGMVIGKRGEKIGELTEVLKKKFKLENPHVEIDEIMKPEFDAQLMADDIAMSLEKFGPLKFKVVAYRALEKIMKAGALGAEIRLSGKLPSSRARTWRFSQGYLKKVGHTAKVVDKAQARAETKPGTVGIKVSILTPNAPLHDKIKIDEELIGKLKMNSIDASLEKKHKQENSKKEKPKKKVRKRKIAEAGASENNKVVNEKNEEIVKPIVSKEKKLINKKISATQGASI